jgi:hypothetical protein
MVGKRSCYRCKALRKNHGSFGSWWYSCDLGYKIREDEIRHADYKETRPVPMENCPKPLTWRALYDKDLAARR